MPPKSIKKKMKNVCKVIVVELVIVAIFFVLVKWDFIRGQFCIEIMNEHTYSWPNWKYICIT